jgi:cold-inducible RNA-binding protein
MANRLYVGNLAFSTTDDALKDAFAEFGEVVEVKLMIERETGRSRGFAFVELATAEAASKAIEQMNGAVLDGRALRVNEAQERPDRGGGGGRRDAGRNRW